MPQLELVHGTLPVGWCPVAGAGALQEIYEKFFDLGYANLPAGAGYSIKISDVGSRPSADEEGTVVWIPTSGGYPLGWYKFQAGRWCMPATQAFHPEDERRLFVGALADVWAYDGGSGDNPATLVPTSVTGAMWEVDADFAAKIPMGVGTTAGGTAIAVATNAGADEVSFTLTDANLPAHFHWFNVDGNYSGVAFGSCPDATSHLRVGAGTEIDVYNGVGPKDCRGKTYNQTGDATSATAVDLTTIPPVRGCYIIKRTIRRYYTI